jgi:hypothetical protein
LSGFFAGNFFFFLTGGFLATGFFTTGFLVAGLATTLDFVVVGLGVGLVVAAFAWIGAIRQAATISAISFFIYLTT